MKKIRRRGEEDMIVSPNKGLFFIGTALMCSASLYAAELTSPQGNPLTAMFNDPMTRIFVGEPNQLTLPPNFADGDLGSDRDDECAGRIADGGLATGATQMAALVEADCQAARRPVAGAIVLPGAVSALATRTEAKVEPASVDASLQTH
jgi:hypothetical protein